MPDGSFIADGEGHYYMIESMEGDQQKLRLLADGVRSFGIDEGAPCFFRGNRIVDDETYEIQKERLLAGLTPDIWDVAAAQEEMKRVRKRR
jgi:hypothetical protein